MLAAPAVARISLKNILFPTDFSPVSTAALPFAAALARFYGATLFVAHAIPPEPHRQVVLDRLPAEDLGVWQDARQQLTALTRDPSLTGARCIDLLDRGDLRVVIPEMIHDHEVDLIVLGTHGRRGVTKMMLGSGAEKIYRTASCPVMTVGPKAHERAVDWQLRRILCPIDVAEDPQPVLHYALSLAEERQAAIIILQAIPLVPWQHRESVEKRSHLALQKLIPPRADGYIPEVLIRWDHPVEAILHVSVDREADLIVMSVHKSRATAFSSHLPWPVASEVVSRAQCPVLTVRI